MSLLLLLLLLFRVLCSRPMLVRAKYGGMRAGRWPHHLFDNIICFSGVLSGAQGGMRMLELHQVVENIRNIAKVVLNIGRRG